MLQVYPWQIGSFFIALVCFAAPVDAKSLEELTSDEELPASQKTLELFASPEASSLPDPVEFCTDPECFVGPEACSKCHQAEYQIWAESAHANKAFDLLRTSSNAKEYAEKLGIDADRVTSAKRCLTCHSTPQSHREKRTGLVHGVTCESCHNAAGGQDGWLNAHTSYGSNCLRREDESPSHHLQRIDRCEAAGQYRSRNFYALAKRCYECHIVSDEELVVTGGHHPGNLGFEMTHWFDHGVRHNVFLNPHHNGLAPSLEMHPTLLLKSQPGTSLDHRRLMYVVSLLVDLEISVQNRGSATHASFARAAGTRIAAAHSRLSKIASDRSPELLSVVEGVDELKAKLFIAPNEDDEEEFLKMADLISEAAKRISTKGGGAQFSAADQFIVPATK